MPTMHQESGTADKIAGELGAQEKTEKPDKLDKDACCTYMQNRELSWLTFNERVLDQGFDPSVPLLERLQFVSIFWSNLQEFFMVRVGSLTDLSLLKKEVIDNKSKMTPSQQLDAVYARCHELYPLQENIYKKLRKELDEAGIHQLEYAELSEEQQTFTHTYLHDNVLPFLSPQIINARHPFPHLENGALYIIVRLTEEEKKKSEMTREERDAAKEARKKAKNMGAEGVTLGIIPLPKQARRIIKLPGDGFNFILLESALEAMVAEVYSMYTVKHANIICITRNADLDATEGADEREEDYREHMKKILKKRARLAPVRLESQHKLSSTVSEFLLARLNLQPHQTFVTSAPLDMRYAFTLPSIVDDATRDALTSKPFSPSWPACLSHEQRMMDQVQDHEVLLSYPYESMDPFVQLLRECIEDPMVVSIKITLYRLTSQSHLAEALIAAAEHGKEVTALFELRARFDESNNIQWSQRFEEAGANVIYGFHDYKVHSKICCITRKTGTGLQYITQLGTGNYNEKTAKLYTDFSFITTDRAIGHDAVEFFRNMGLENTSRDYQTLWVAPLQIKQNILAGIDVQIAAAKAGRPSGLFFKTNSITDKEIIEKIAEASRAGVKVLLLVRGISCIVPGIKGATENVRVVSIVGRLLEHSRIYGFGPRDNMDEVYLSSADLMTRNMDKRIEIAWPVHDPLLKSQLNEYIAVCLRDTAKLRELKPDRTYTPLGALTTSGKHGQSEPFNAQEYLIAEAKTRSDKAREQEMEQKSAFEKLSMQAHDAQQIQTGRAASVDLEETYREALKHEMPDDSDETLQPFVRAAARAFAQAGLEVSNFEHAQDDNRSTDEPDDDPPKTPSAAEVEPQLGSTVVSKDTPEPALELQPEPAADRIMRQEAPNTGSAARVASTSTPEQRPPAKKHGFFWRLFHRGI